MSTVEETLAWEAQWRPRAAAAAIGGAVAGMAGGIMLAILGRDGPTEDDGYISLPESLRAAAEGTTPNEESLAVRLTEFRGDKVELFTLSTILSVLGAIGALLALTYLFRAARARNPQITRAVGWSVAAALALYPLGRGAREIATWIEYANFDGTTAAAQREIGTEGIIPGAALLEILGAFALALAFVLVSMNAMRVGLLTRFMGILGVIVGALAVFQLDAPQVVRGLWLLFLGLLIAGRYPGGRPPAWETGRAEPWPSQQELRERRDAVRAEHDAREEEPAPATPAARQKPRKRKKRR